MSTDRNTGEQPLGEAVTVRIRDFVGETGLLSSSDRGMPRALRRRHLELERALCIEHRTERANARTRRLRTSRSELRGVGRGGRRGSFMGGACCAGMRSACRGLRTGKSTFMVLEYYFVELHRHPRAATEPAFCTCQKVDRCQTRATCQAGPVPGYDKISGLRRGCSGIDQTATELLGKTVDECAFVGGGAGRIDPSPVPLVDREGHPGG